MLTPDLSAEIGYTMSGYKGKLVKHWCRDMQRYKQYDVPDGMHVQDRLIQKNKFDEESQNSDIFVRGTLHFHTSITPTRHVSKSLQNKSHSFSAPKNPSLQHKSVSTTRHLNINPSLRHVTDCTKDRFVSI